MIIKNYNSYIHIPFCRSKCKYCRFASFGVLNKLFIQKYVDFLFREIETSEQKGSILDTIYFGGGTPAILEKKQIEQIFEILKKTFIFTENIEITIETTPSEISLEKLEFWIKNGVNRLSIGVQTLNKKSLREIGRDKKGNIEEKLDLINNFFKDGFKSISLDFIIGLPFVKYGEILENIKYLLKKYDFINHISVYMLEDYYNSGEKNEKFEQIIYPKEWLENSINSDEIGKEYIKIKNFLEKKGFFRYELSNFAKSRFECKHNLGYWDHKETLAFGLGASGFLEKTRFKNSEDFLKYFSFSGIEKEKLTNEELFLEKIMFSIRTFGISEKDLKYLNLDKINYFLENGYLEKNKERIILSDRGSLYLDYILKEII